VDADTTAQIGCGNWLFVLIVSAKRRRLRTRDERPSLWTAHHFNQKSFGKSENKAVFSFH
jgi:hypothetical protein